MRKWKWYLCLAAILMGCCACGRSDGENTADMEEWMSALDLEYEIVDGSDVPQKVYERIFHKQKERFGFTYRDGDSQFIALGFGIVPSSGYQIRIQHVKETESRIVVEAELIAPLPEEVVRHKETYPSMILKVANTDKQVQFRLNEE